MFHLFSLFALMPFDGTSALGTGYVMSSTTHSICPCNDGANKEQCIVQDMFASIQFFKENSTSCVSPNTTAYVKAKTLRQTVKTMQLFDSFNKSCSTESGTLSSSDYLSINGKSKCISFECCIQCLSCPQNKLLNEQGPIILKDTMEGLKFHLTYEPIIMCAALSEQVAGFQEFRIRFFNEPCMVDVSSSPGEPETSTLTFTHSTTLFNQRSSNYFENTLQTSTIKSYCGSNATASPSMNAYSSGGTSTMKNRRATKKIQGKTFYLPSNKSNITMQTVTTTVNVTAVLDTTLDKQFESTCNNAYKQAFLDKPLNIILVSAAGGLGLATLAGTGLKLFGTSLCTTRNIEPI